MTSVSQTQAESSDTANPSMAWPRGRGPDLGTDLGKLCFNCSQPFTRKDKGWNRYRVERIASENTWTTVFGKPALYKPWDFICRTCYRFLVCNTRPSRSTNGPKRTSSPVRILQGANPIAKQKADSKATAIKPNPANDRADVSEERTDNDTLTLATPLAEPEEIIEDDVEEIIEDDTSATPPANTDVPEERTEDDTPPAESAIKLPELHYSKDVSTVGPPPKNWQWVLVPVLRPCDPNKATLPQRSVEGHTSTKGQKKKSQIQGPVLHAPVSDGDKAPQETTKGNSSSTSSAKEKNRYLILGPYHQVSDEDRAPQEKTTDDSSTTPSTEQQKGLPTQGPLPPATVAGGDKAPQEKNKGASSSPAATAQNKKYLLVGPLPHGPDQAKDKDKAPQEKTTDDSSTTPSTEQQKGLPTQGPLPPATVAGGDKAPQEKNKGASSSPAATAQNKKYLLVGPLPHGPDQAKDKDKAPQEKTTDDSSTTPSTEQQKGLPTQGPLPPATVAGGDKAPQEKNKGASSSTAATAQKKKYLLVGSLPRGPDQGSDRARQKKGVLFTISSRDIQKLYDSPNLLPQAPVSGGDKLPQTTSKRKSTYSSILSSKQRKQSVLTQRTLPRAPDTGGDKLPQTTSKRKSTYSSILSSKQRKQSVLTQRTLPRAPDTGGDRLPQTTSKRKSTYPTILSSKRRKQSVLTQRTLPRAPDTDGGKAPSTLPLVKRWTSQMKQNSASNTDGDKAPQKNTKSDSTITPSARRRKQVLTPGGGKNALESRGLTTPSRLLKNGEDANLERSIPFSSSLPNEHSEDDEVDDRPPPRRKTMKDLAIEYIVASKYRLAFKKLYEESQQARKAFLAFAQEMIRKEVKAMKCKKPASGYSRPFSIGNVRDFRWDELVDETEKVMPITFGCMSAILPSTERIKQHMRRLKGKIGAKRNMTDEEAQAHFNRRLGQMVAIGLFTNRPRIFKFVQTCMGFELWRQGVSTKVFRMLNHSGICLSIAAATGYVESLTENHDEKLKEWKKTFEDAIPNTRTKGYQKRVVTSAPTFGLHFNRVLEETESPHLGGTPGNKFFVQQTMCYAAKDRVQYRMVTAPVATVAQAAETLDAFTFLPAPDVLDRQRLRLVDVVANIMSRHMTFLQDLSRDLPIAQGHVKSDCMSQKSELVTLGIVPTNPGTTQGIETGWRRHSDPRQW
ncbi:uncharacterized protein [Diadema antillarum]|uniref:uncharacterized protein n=1 Tax=Diadema antillarum TaxID=105358 RepID=UPI003A86428B